MRAIVIGGGIGGPVAAMALRKAGIDASVHERYDRRSDGSGGALSIAPNGVQALEVVGLADAVMFVVDASRPFSSPASLP